MPCRGAFDRSIAMVYSFAMSLWLEPFTLSDVPEAMDPGIILQLFASSLEATATSSA